MRDLLAGFSDYANQTLADIVKDFNGWIENLNQTINMCGQYKEKIESTGYWKKVPMSFQSTLARSLKLFSTALEEIMEIEKEIKTEVRQDHVNRIRALGDKALEMDAEISDAWHRDYDQNEKEYGNANFENIEHIYSEIRSMALDMLDLQNAATRLEDFVGRKNANKTENTIESKIDYLELKPNFFGLGLNFNQILKRIYGKFRKKAS